MATFTEEYKQAVEEKADRWVPGCGGLEQPFTYDGVRYLYVFNPARGEHGYLNLDTDLVQENFVHYTTGLES